MEVPTIPYFLKQKVDLGAASRTVWAALSGACSPRTTPSGSHRGNASRGGASDSVLR